MDKKKEKKSVLQLLFGFMDRANGDHVGAYAAQAAYFLIMSFIPFILSGSHGGVLERQVACMEQRERVLRLSGKKKRSLRSCRNIFPCCSADTGLSQYR